MIYLKNKLKKINTIYRINSLIKEKIMHYEHDILYGNLPDISDNYLELVEYKLKLKSNKIKKTKNKKLKILWVGACYQQDYSGFIQALEKFGDVIFFTQENGKYGLEAPINRNGLIYDKERVKNSDRLYNLFLDNGGGNEIDLVIGQMWSTLIDPSVLLKIKNDNSFVINIAMDDKLPVHWKKDRKGRLAGAIGLADSVDLTLNTCIQSVNLYASKDFPCIYWPLASDGNIFTQSKEKIYDVVFVGSNYGYRSEIIKYLKKSGINIVAFGPGFPSGMLSPQESADIFSKSKIILGIGFVGFSRRLSTLKLRDFDAMFTGSLYITSRNKDLEVIFKDEDSVVYYDSLEDLVFKINKYLNNDIGRNKISENAIKLANTHHTWNKRLSDTFKFIGLIKNE